MKEGSHVKMCMCMFSWTQVGKRVRVYTEYSAGEVMAELGSGWHCPSVTRPHSGALWEYCCLSLLLHTHLIGRMDMCTHTQAHRWVHAAALRSDDGKTYCCLKHTVCKIKSVVSGTLMFHHFFSLCPCFKDSGWPGAPLWAYNKCALNWITAI